MSEPDNPLALLGMPNWVVDRAMAENDYSIISDLADPNYRRLSKLVHPDIATTAADAELFDRLTKARDLLKDPDDAAVACEFYVDAKTVGSLRDRQLLEEQRQARYRATEAAVGALANVNQMAVFGQSKPIVALVSDHTGGMYNWVLRVLAADRLEVSLMRYPENQSPHSAARYVDGAWQEEVQVMRDEPLDQIDYDDPIILPGTRLVRHEEQRYPADWRIIGSVPLSATPYAKSIDALVDSDRAIAFRLHTIADDESRRLDQEPEKEVIMPWTDVSTTWWLQHLQPRVVQGNAVAVINVASGQLSLMGAVREIAPLT